MFSPQLRKILVAVDLSEISFHAWDQAAEIARFFAASIEVVHVVRPGLAGVIGRRAEASLREQKRAARERIGSRRPGGRVHVVAGEPVPVLLELAGKLEPDLVVMGTHGRRGLERLFLGSVAESVFRKSQVPVLVVRGPSRAIRSILIPVEPMDYSVTGFSLTSMFAFDLRAAVTVLNVAGDSRLSDTHAFLAEMIGRMPEQVRRVCEPRILVAEGGAVAEVIASVADKHDLVALVYHRKSGFGRLGGTTLERVLRRCAVPVLAVPFIDPDSPERRRIIGEFSS